MTLTRVKLERFTAFDELDLELSPGINVLVGANGTGKTHLMKICYAACDVSKTGMPFTEKLVEIFLPSRRSLGRLVKRGRSEGRSGTETIGHIELFRGEIKLVASLRRYSPRHRSVLGAREWIDAPIESVYIPVKEMLSNAPGFRSLYAQREIHFEEVYKDILDRALLPALRDVNEPYRRLISQIQAIIGGRVVNRDSEEFFLIGRRPGTLEFTLLAEGFRKLGLLSLLMQNGSLRGGSVLFWDEPETNLNPKMFGMLMEVLLELQRNGVQIFFATHDYGILKELDLRMREDDEVAFHSLYHDETGEIACNTTRRYLDIHPNAITEAFDDLYDRQIERSLGDFGR